MSKPLFVITLRADERHAAMRALQLRHVLRRMRAMTCFACSAPLARDDVALARTAAGASRTDVYHLRCAAAAHFAAELQLQPMLRECATRSGASGPLSERDLARIYDELGSDARRAAPEPPKPAAKEARR